MSELTIGRPTGETPSFDRAKQIANIDLELRTISNILKHTKSHWLIIRLLGKSNHDSNPWVSVRGSSKSTIARLSVLAEAAPSPRVSVRQRVDVNHTGNNFTGVTNLLPKIDFARIPSESPVLENHVGLAECGTPSTAGWKHAQSFQTLKTEPNLLRSFR